MSARLPRIDGGHVRTHQGDALKPPLDHGIGEHPAVDALADRAPVGREIRQHGLLLDAGAPDRRFECHSCGDMCECQFRGLRSRRRRQERQAWRKRLRTSGMSGAAMRRPAWRRGNGSIRQPSRARCRELLEEAVCIDGADGPGRGDFLSRSWDRGTGLSEARPHRSAASDCGWRRCSRSHRRG